jgi:LmbE family N-acetylglucosaminyl deacetylase
LIVPLVPEETWLSVLESAQTWIPAGKETLVISPHPDDETLGEGGLIATQAGLGLTVQIAAVTDGEAAYPALPGLAETRRKEQAEAVRCLGLRNPIIRLGLPDSDVSRHEAELTELLRPLIHPNMLVVAPWIHDWHPDHEACARVAERLCEEKNAELVSYLFWTWHRRTAEVFEGVRLLRLELSPDVQAAKQRALACHVSQLQHDSAEPILPALLLAPAFRPFETLVSHGVF